MTDNSAFRKALLPFDIPVLFAFYAISNIFRIIRVGDGEGSFCFAKKISIHVL